MKVEEGRRETAREDDGAGQKDSETKGANQEEEAEPSRERMSQPCSWDQLPASHSARNYSLLT